MAESRGIRARRDGWARLEKISLTKRDIEILYTIGVCGVVRTCDIARFFFGSRGTANDRLRKLFCAGLIECFVRDLAADNFYALTVRGRDAVLDYHEVDPADLRVVRKLPAKLEHQIAITEIRLSVNIGCRTSPRYELVSFETDADLAAARHAALLDLIPDAKIAIRTKTTGEVHTFLLEMDLGTEAVTWLVRHKLAVYARHAQIGTALYGLHDPLVVLVVPGLRRARNIARLLADERVQARVVFALRPDLTEENIFGAAYALPADLLTAADDAEALRAFKQRLLPP